MQLELPSLYVDHLVDPRGQHDLPQPEAEGHHGSVVGGMGVRVTLSWRPGHSGEPLIRAAGVRVFGSPAPLAPASYLSEYVVGMTPENAEDVRAEDLLEALVGRRHVAALPEAVHRGAAHAVAALHCALGLPGYRPADPEGDGLLVCRCLTVGDRAIRHAVQRGARTPEAVRDATRAGAGCGSCRSDVLVIIDQETTNSGAQPPPHLDPLARITLALASPTLRACGLPLRDVRVTRDGVALAFGRMAEEAYLRPPSAQALVRRFLRDTVHPAIQVHLL